MKTFAYRSLSTAISMAWTVLTRTLHCAAHVFSCLIVLFLCLASAPASAGNNAALAAQRVPSSMVAGTVYNVTVTMKNTGTTTWTTQQKYALGSQHPENGLTWGLNRISLRSSVRPGSLASFTVPVNAPVAPGTYHFQWRMVQDDVEWFGPYTPDIAVTVKAAGNDAELSAISVPTTMRQGRAYSVAVTMKNTGTTTWPAGGAYKLGSQNPQDNLIWGMKRVDLTRAISPGQRYTFAFKVTAPAPGGYAMRWQMVQEDEEWFGAMSNSPVSVSAATGAPTISVSRTPAPMTAGQPYTLTWSSTNATTVSRVCTASAGGYTVHDAPALSGSASGTASPAWVGHPSSCTWTARGAGGTATARETMTTNEAATTTAGGVTYIHTDGLGSPVARTDANAKVISRTRYEPYGLTADGDTPTIGFTGHVNDADTGLVYMQQRYYDPVGGRFLSIDPVASDAETGSSFSRYAYAYNNPYRYTDPDGRFNSTDCANMGGNCTNIGSLQSDATYHGLNANFTNSRGVSFTDTAPRELEELRKKNPELVRHEDEIRRDSEGTLLNGFLGIGKSPVEQSLVVYRKNDDGSLLYDRRYRSVYDPKTGEFSTIPLPKIIPAPQGYSLLLLEHTHPWPYSFGVSPGPVMGPSPNDAYWARNNPGAYHAVQAKAPGGNPWQFFYYGPKR